MKRMHVHVGVTDLDRSVAFYSTLFGGAPTVRNSTPTVAQLDRRGQPTAKTPD